MKKICTLLAAALTAGSLLAGCGNSGDDGVLTSKSGAEKVTVKFWSHYTVNPEYQNQLIDEFNKTHDDVEIEINMINDQYSDMLNLSMSSNDSPDVFTITGPSMTKKVTQMNWAKPLNEYVTEEFKDKFQGDVWINNNNVIDGKIMMVPDQSATFRMLYNTELFKRAGIAEPPSTFEEMREAAKKISALGDDISGFGLELSDTYQLDLSVFNGIGNYALGTLQGFDYAKGEFDFSVYKPAIELFRNMRKDGSLMDGELLLDVDTVRAKFGEGKVGMIPSVSWETSMICDMNPAFTVGVANWPTVDGTPRGKNTIQISSGFAMSNQCKNPDAAWKVIAFLSSEEFTGKLNQKNATISLLKDDNASDEFVNVLQPEFLPNEKDAVWPAIVPSLKMKGDFKGPVFIRLITDDTADIDAELKDLTERSNQAFKDAAEAGELKAEDYYIEGFNPIDLK